MGNFQFTVPEYHQIGSLYFSQRSSDFASLLHGKDRIAAHIRQGRVHSGSQSFRDLERARLRLCGKAIQARKQWRLRLVQQLNCSGYGNLNIAVSRNEDNNR